MSDKANVDALVIGAGITGLLAARGLARQGSAVLLVESQHAAASGATTQNEGWLHHGTYHAISIDDPASARAVAARCLYGASYLKAIAPEAIEEPLLPSYAFTARSDYRDLEQRWKSAGVKFRPVSRNDLLVAVPETNVSDVTAAYAVDDRALDTRVLCTILLSYLRTLGVTVAFNSEIKRISSHTFEIATCDDRYTVAPKVVILTCGYRTQETAQSLEIGDLPQIRLWKSHLVVSRRFSASPVFSLDPDEPALMNHGGSTIIGLNDDARRSATVDNDPDPEHIDHLLGRFAKRFNLALHRDTLSVACTKVDFATDSAQPRSLAPTASKLDEQCYALLPGKMTEAPYIVNRALPRLMRRLGYDDVRERPCDRIKEMDDDNWAADIWTN